MAKENISKPKSWRDVIPVHPAANMFPMLDKDELRALGEDIKKNGLTHPVYLRQERNQMVLIDGRNRFDAMEAVGLQVLSKDGTYLASDLHHEFLGKKIDPYAFVVSANILRRHLTPEQGRELIAKLLKAAPEKSNRQIAKIAKRSPTTVGTVRRELEATVQIGQLEKTVGADGRARPSRGKTKAAAPAEPKRKRKTAPPDLEPDPELPHDEPPLAISPLDKCVGSVRQLVFLAIRQIEAPQLPELFVRMRDELDEIESKVGGPWNDEGEAASIDPDEIPGFIKREAAGAPPPTA